MSNWTWEPWVVISLSSAIVAYAIGVLRLLRAGRLMQVLNEYRLLAFASGILSLVIALISPLDALAERSFAAHMSQHMLLIMVAPPLLIYARPILVGLWIWSLPRRRKIGLFWRRAAVLRGIYEFILRPEIAWLAASITLFIWHIPQIYDAALADEAIHTFEHLSFFITSLLFWSLIFDPQRIRHIGHNTAMIMVLTYGIQNGLLGALLTFAQTPLFHYEGSYEYALHDQQLAGVIMWVPAGLIHLATFTWLCVSWIKPIRKMHVAVAEWSEWR